MKKKDSDPCVISLLYVVAAFFIYLLYKFISFVQTPEGIRRTVEFFEGLGICVGLAILAFVALYIYSLISSRKPRFKLNLMSKEYPARCDLVELMSRVPGAAAAVLPETANLEATIPIHLLVSLTNFGLGIMPLPEDYTWDCVSADNASRFNHLSSDKPGPIILPMGFFSLAYVSYSQQVDQTFESPTVQSTGFDGTFPAPPDTGLIKIIINYKAIIHTENVEHINTLDQGMKLTLVALDKNGQDDTATTAELFKAVYEFIQTAYNAPGEDDSWMYQSRPIFPPFYY